MHNELLQALQNPALYDHPVQQFQLVETHISWILLTGEFAYKIKKPVNFGFLDFSSLHKRHHFCELELKLNRRLAPQLYLKVLPITGSATNPCLNGRGPIIDYTVQIRQFDQNGLFDRLAAQQEIRLHHIDQLADQIAKFHLQAQIADEASAFGEPDQVYAAIQQNFDQIRPRLTHARQRGQIEQLEAWSQDAFERLRPVLEQRKATGFIRECHGDLHLGNITRYQGNVTIFDCLEFNEGLRWIDVISDLAFLIMDLEQRQLQRQANHLLNFYLEQTGDYDGLQVLTFYKVYRAMVRAKVALLSQPTPAQDKSSTQPLWQQTFDSYVSQAEAFTKLPNRCLLITHGLSGSGKTTLSSKLVDRLGLIRLRSDVERKRLHGLSALARSGSSLDNGLYHASATDATYQRMALLAQVLLQAGFAVLVDATFLQRQHRQSMVAVAEQQGVPFVILSCEAAPAQVTRWLQQREAAQNDASEANLAVLAKQQSQREPLSEVEQYFELKVQTDHAESVQSLLQALDLRLQ